MYNPQNKKLFPKRCLHWNERLRKLGMHIIFQVNHNSQTSDYRKPIEFKLNSIHLDLNTLQTLMNGNEQSIAS